jgi:hypothetical protein
VVVVVVVVVAVVVVVVVVVVVFVAVGPRERKVEDQGTLRGRWKSGVQAKSGRSTGGRSGTRRRGVGDVVEAATQLLELV